MAVAPPRGSKTHHHKKPNKDKDTTIGRKGIFRYNICNGLSNQLLYHAASIAQAISQNYAVVEIPDYFILQGVQVSNATVLPTKTNAIHFGHVFDADYFVSSLLQKFGIQGRLVRFWSSSSQQLNNNQSIPHCKGMASLQAAPADTMQTILDLFRPSPQHMQPLIDAILSKLESSSSSSSVGTGVCLHHRDGQDWHDHCKRWTSIPDGIYRGNCLGVPGQSLLETVQSRGLQPGRWGYYCGDHVIPSQLLLNTTTTTTSQGVPMTSRQTILDSWDDNHMLQKALLHQQTVLSQNYPELALDLDQARDFWALLDFYVCRTLPYFVGNSVSTFSAIQIALRKGHGAYWYNSQSIPLQEMWPVFPVPIVYTYTELSATTGKHLLQTSIESVRSHMPENKVHILYHGRNDTKFKSWLQSRNVIIHDHDPPWRNKIEEMRLNGDANTSNLFLHSGNYFGTWQRIDIPMFLETEYVLLLDSDTIIRKPFTLADFGLNLTYGIAMSSEINFEDTVPSNAGVMLMNIPHLRHTHKEFMAFIMRHVPKGRFDHPSPSDQGAYLVFYNDTVRFLSPYFNFKPYWEVQDRIFQRAHVIHYHGPKPHDYIRFIMGKGCDKAVKFLCARGIRMTPSLLCQSLRVFARTSMSVNRTAYCKASFQHPSQAAFCQELFEHMSSSFHGCQNFYGLIRDALDSVPPFLKLPRQLILKRLGLASEQGILYWILLYGTSIVVFGTLAVYLVRMRSRSTMTLLKASLVVVVVWSIMAAFLALSHLENHAKQLSTVA